MKCIVDIETDGLVEDVKVVHCIVAKDISTMKFIHSRRTSVTTSSQSSLKTLIILSCIME